MEKQKKQTMRFNDSELDLIKTTFKDNDALLFAIRKFFLQLPMGGDDAVIIDSLKKNKNLLAIIRKAFLPEIDGNAPIHQVVDLWMTLDLKDKTPELAFIQIQARSLVIEYLNSILNSLESDIGYSLKLEKLCEISNNPDLAMESQIRLIARNTIIGHTEMQLNQFSILAAQLNMTEEERKELVKQNSSK